MYRYITGLAASLLALTLTQCASVQEVEAPRLARASFEVYASPAETRTVNDGMDTRWETGDRFSLFHAPAGTSAFRADGAFTIDAPDTGHARGAVSGLEEGENDWYMVYPFANAAVSPASVPVTVGAPTGEPQVQQGKDSRAHLAGENFPVGGKALGVSTPETPVLTAAPLISVIAVNVTNPGEGLVKVNSVSFKAPEAIVGSFQVDVTGNAPVFQAVSASDEAILSVEGSAYIRAGESAVFYLGIKPFTAYTGSTLTVTVNDQVRTVTLPRAYTFSAGQIKRMNVTLDESAPTAQYFFKRVTEVTSGRKYILVAEVSENDLRMAGQLPADKASGSLPAEPVTESEDEIITLDVMDNAFVFTLTDNGYTIRQQDGRYLYNGNKNEVCAGTDPGTTYYWAIAFGEDGLAVIQSRDRRLMYNSTSSTQKFQTMKITSSSIGRNPRLYELMNDDEMAQEFVQKTVPGVYGFSGFDWLYADGVSQTSVRTLAGTTAFRIFYPEDFTVLQVTGIPAAPVVNDRIDIRFVRYVKQAATHADNFLVTVLKVEDGKAWLMTDGGIGFLVQIQ